MVSHYNITVTSITIAALVLITGVLAISGTLTPAYAATTGFSWLKGCDSPVDVGTNLNCQASAQYAPSQTHTFELLNAVDCINGLANEVGITTAITCSNVAGGDTPVTTVPFGTTSDKVTISGVTGNAKCSGANNQLPCIIAKGSTSGTIDGLVLPNDANNGEVDFADTSYSISTTTFTYAGASTHILHDQIGLVWIDKSDVNAQNNNYAAGGSANVLQLTPTLVTSSSKTGTPSLPITSVSDSGTISGTAGIPTGTVIFTLVDHSDGDTQVGGPTAPATLDGAGTASSGSVSPSPALIAGDQYCWNMAFTPSGANTNYAAATELGTDQANQATECFTPQTIVPDLATTSTPTGNTNLPIASVSDSATVGGAGGAGSGSVVFTLVDTTTPATVSTSASIPLVAGAASSGSSSPSLTAGDKYCWNLAYTPDASSPYSAKTETGLTDDPTNECFTPQTIVPDLSTTSSLQGDTDLPITSVSDSATVGGAGGAGSGSVVFTLVDTTTPATVSTSASIPLVAGAASSGPISPSLTAGDQYCWNLAYTPDASSPYSAKTETGLTDDVDGECFTPQTVVPTLATTSTPAGNTNLPIASVSDSATISGAGGAGSGSVVFTLVDTTTPATVSTSASIPLVAGAASSGSSSPSLTTGDKYCWNLDYTPDAASPYSAKTETGLTDDPTHECFTPQTIVPTLATTSTPAGNTNLPIASVSDSATISGAGGAGTGSVVFTLVDTTTPATVSTSASIPLVAGAASSGSSSPSLTTGDKYCWNLSYTPDASSPYSAKTETGLTDDPTHECFTPQTVVPTLATTSTPVGNANLPISSVSDSSTVSGGAGTATGSVIFTLVDTSSANAIVAGPTASIPLVAGAASSGSLTPSLTASHKYCWNLSYTPDASSPYSAKTETGLTDDAAHECFTAIQPAYTATTKSTPSGGVANGQVPIPSPTDLLSIAGTNGVSGTFTVTNAVLHTPNGDLPATASPLTTSSFPSTISVSLSSPQTLSAQGHYCWDETVTASGGSYDTTPRNLVGTDQNGECFTIAGPTGFMTGGGSIIQANGGIPNTRVTHGGELRCDMTKKSNLEINWAGGKFHLDHLTSASCTLDPTIDAGHPKSTFNTFEGTGVGVDGSTIHFIFKDAGEPSQDIDFIHIEKNSVVIVDVTGRDQGNQQAHK